MTTEPLETGCSARPRRFASSLMVLVSVAVKASVQQVDFTTCPFRVELIGAGREKPGGTVVVVDTT